MEVNRSDRNSWKITLLKILCINLQYASHRFSLSRLMQFYLQLCFLVSFSFLSDTYYGLFTPPTRTRQNCLVQSSWLCEHNWRPDTTVLSRCVGSVNKPLVSVCLFFSNSFLFSLTGQRLPGTLWYECRRLATGAVWLTSELKFLVWCDALSAVEEGSGRQQASSRSSVLSLRNTRGGSLSRTCSVSRLHTRDIGLRLRQVPSKLHMTAWSAVC